MPRTTPSRFRTVNTKAEQGGSSKQGRYLKINLNTTLAVEMIETDLLKTFHMDRALIEVVIDPPDETGLQRVTAVNVGPVGGSGGAAELDLDWGVSTSQ
jgi:hypothetical protein